MTMTTPQAPTTGHVRRTGRLADQPLGTVLAVWAHPDDEAFLSAGLMLSALAEGSRVVVATATRGELGTDDPGAWPPERVGALRDAEMRASLAALGVTEHHWLGHRDGGLDLVPLTEGARQLRVLLDAVRPDTLVTFGPDGFTGHPDHRVVSMWVRAAWLTGAPAARLLHAAAASDWVQRWQPLNEGTGVFPHGRPAHRDAASLALRLELSGPALERKLAALRAHSSQIEPLCDSVGAATFASWWSEESFVEAPRSKA